MRPAVRTARSGDPQQRRRLLLAACIYLALTAVFFATVSTDRLVGHTPYNHYALMADGWLHGRLDLGGPPPAYTHNNDFAHYRGKVYVSFPPLPAVLLVPVVALAGSVERVRDGQFFLWLAGIGPAVLFLAFEKLRRTGRSHRGQATNVALSVAFALGTVYWFTAVQGTVWYAAHVVAVGLTALYIWACLDAEHPVIAGLALGLGCATRPDLLLGMPLFAYELSRAVRASAVASGSLRATAARAGPIRLWLKGVAWFSLPIVLSGLALAWHNHARFGSATEFGHHWLKIAWSTRISEWGLFSYHYLGRNLSVVLAGLPFHGPKSGWQVNAHGLALWITTPLYLWALWPRRVTPSYWAAAASAAAVATACLLYQNTGWTQFGYRFSNDFAPFLFLMIVLGRRRFGPAFWLVALLGIVVNAFGALTFERPAGAHLYFVDGSQKVLVQPD
jgi:hypothetical protein